MKVPKTELPLADVAPQLPKTADALGYAITPYVPPDQNLHPDPKLGNNIGRSKGGPDAQTQLDLKENEEQSRDDKLSLMMSLASDSQLQAIDQAIYLLRRAKIPKIAPELYSSRDRSEDALKFVERVYGQYLTGEFTRADLRRLDRPALLGLENWEHYRNQRAPLNLPAIYEDTAQGVASGVDALVDVMRRVDRVTKAAQRPTKAEPKP